MLALTWIAFLLILSPPAQEMAVVCQNDFHTLPENWLSYGWNFGPNGATMAASSTEWESKLFTAGSDSLATTAIYFVPDGTERISIGIPYYLYAMVNEGCAGFTVSLFTESSDSVIVWQEEFFWIEGSSGSGSVEESIDWNSSLDGHWIGFSFYSSGGHSPGGSATAIWTIHDLTVTASGDLLRFQPRTWGSLKQHVSL